MALFEILSVCQGGGYRYCRTDPPHPRRNAKGLYPLHRVLAENKLGRLLDRREHVRFRDGDKTNDAPDNLEVIDSGAHGALVAKARKAPDVACVCPCGTQFTLPAHVYSLRSRRNRDGEVYCGRSCATALTRP